MTRPEGRKLIQALGGPGWPVHLFMARAYEGEQTRQLVLELGFEPVVPPKSSRLQPWQYDAQIYKRRNELERLFRRVKGVRRFFGRFAKLNVMLLGFITFAFIVEALIDSC